jgi:hypothetical protein
MVAMALLATVALSCGSDADDSTRPLADDGAATGTCLEGDPNCSDLAGAGAAAPLPDAISLGDPNDPNAPILINFGGFFYSTGEVSQLCAALAESFPPQCASSVIVIDAPLDVALAHVAESFGNPDDAKINIDQGIYWTEVWVNLSGVLENNQLVLEG